MCNYSYSPNTYLKIAAMQSLLRIYFVMSWRSRSKNYDSAFLTVCSASHTTDGRRRQNKAVHVVCTQPNLKNIFSLSHKLILAIFGSDMKIIFKNLVLEDQISCNLFTDRHGDRTRWGRAIPEMTIAIWGWGFEPICVQYEYFIKLQCRHLGKSPNRDPNLCPSP